MKASDKRLENEARQKVHKKHLITAHAVASEMGKAWKLDETKNKTNPALVACSFTIVPALDNLHESGIQLAFDWFGAEGKVNISGLYPRLDDQYVSLGIHDDTPSINVSHARAPRAIASAIRARLMNDYTKRLELVIGVIERAGAYRAEVEQTAARLAAAIGAEAISPRYDRERPRSRVLFNHKDPRVSVTVQAHDGRAVVEISASTDVLEHVLKTLRKQINK